MSQLEHETIVRTRLLSYFGKMRAGLTLDTFQFQLMPRELRAFEGAQVLHCNFPEGFFAIHPVIFPPTFTTDQVRDELVKFTVMRVDDVLQGRSDPFACIRRSVKNTNFAAMYGIQGLPVVCKEFCEMVAVAAVFRAPSVSTCDLRLCGP